MLSGICLKSLWASCPERRALEEFGVPGISCSVSFSFEPRNPLDLVFLLVVPDVAYFCVDAIVNLSTLKNTF